MSESDNESKNNSTIHVSVFEQRAYEWRFLSTINMKLLSLIEFQSAAVQRYYKTLVVKKSQLEIRKKRPGMLQHGVSIRTNSYRADNARPRVGAPVVGFLEEYGWGERLNRPPYSTDLRAPDLFPEPHGRIRFPDI